MKEIESNIKSNMSNLLTHSVHSLSPQY